MGDVKPISGWEVEPQPDVVWASRLDNRYLVEVVQHTLDPYAGRLRIFDKDNEFAVLLDEPTPISYGAPFGPDVDDVSQWQQRVMEVVDQ